MGGLACGAAGDWILGFMIGNGSGDPLKAELLALHSGLYLIWEANVIGSLTAISTEVEFSRNGVPTKMIQIEITSGGPHTICVLFGEYVEELNAFLQAGNISNVVVVLLLAKLRTFQGEIQLQNAFNCSKLLFNPDHPDVVCLQKSLAENNETSNQTLSQITDLSRPLVEDEFLKLYPRTTISGLVDCKTYYQRTIFIVLGSIEEIVNPDDWSYKACKCNKSVKHNEGRIHDFNFEGFAIIQKSAKDVEANVVKGGDKLSIPQEIRDIMHKQFLFKVEAKEDFGGEYKLTAGLNCTKVMFNPDIPQAVSYRERYKLLLNVADDTGSATFTVLYREGCYLMNKKGNEILEKMEKTGSMEHPPQEIVDLVHKEFLFKVEGKDTCGRWFNPAFNVLKICKDQQIISKFETKTITKSVKRNTPPPILEDSNTPIKHRSDEGSITEVVGSNDAEMFKKIKFSKN
ncbi:uncharacterized protein LOC130714874 [Lotus japonicus]|uniref:uncharacterized protein LOC130714874 n=1 Tax=Lotus japonicus TaxID=34305 RepID=UPI00258EE214|nr:uncharacterized protein LOC130714874 [Lotus japonicus]